MATAEPLYQLIRSMGRREKQLFKLQAANHSRKGGNKYVEAFDLINKYREKEDADITGRLEKQFKGENIPSIKNYLMEAVTETLANHSRRFRITQRINKLQAEAAVLRDRGIFLYAHKQILKGKKLARSVGRFDLVRSLIETERTIVGSNRGKLFPAGAIHELMDESMQVTTLLQEEALARKVYYQIFDKTIRGSTQEAKARMKELLEQPDFDKLRHTKNPNAEMYFHCSWAQYYHLTKQNDLSEESHLEILRVFKSMPALKQESPYFYNSTIHNILSQKYLKRELEEVFPYLIEIFGVQFESKIEQIKQFETQFANTFFYAFSTSQHLTGTVWEEVITKFEDYKKLIAPVFLIDYQLKRAIYHFNLGEFEEALEWIILNINSEKLSKMATHDTISFLVFIMAHYECGNFETAAGLAKAKKRTANYNSLNLEMYDYTVSLIINLFEKQLDKKRLFQEYLQQLSKLDHHYSVYIEAEIWAQSHIDGTSFPALLAQQRAHLPRIPLKK